MKSDTDCFKDWVLQLDRDDKVSLGLFLAYQYLSIGDTKAVELAGIMIGKSMMTIVNWRTYFLDNNCEIPESRAGKYERQGVVWNNEHLNKKATKCIRNNNTVKGKPNLTIGGFCEWVNNDLKLVNQERLVWKWHRNGCISWDLK